MLSNWAHKVHAFKQVMGSCGGIKWVAHCIHSVQTTKEFLIPMRGRLKYMIKRPFCKDLLSLIPCVSHVGVLLPFPEFGMFLTLQQMIVLLPLRPFISNPHLIRQ